MLTLIITGILNAILMDRTKQFSANLVPSLGINVHACDLIYKKLVLILSLIAVASATARKELASLVLIGTNLKKGKK